MTKTELLTNDSPIETPEPQLETGPVAPPQRSHGPLWIAFVLVFLLTGLLAGTGYWFYTQFYQPLAAEVQSQRQLAQDVNVVNDGLQRLQAASNQQSNSHNQATVAIAELQGQTTALEKRLSVLNVDVAALSGNRTSQWLVAEADYLARMAGRKLWLEEDIRTAVKLLEEADRRLAETADPAYLVIRKAIAADIQRIQQVNPVAVTSTALALSGIIGAMDDLPLDALQLPEATSGAPTPVSDNVADWQDNLGRVWHAIMDDFVTVRRRDTAVEPLMSDAQRFLATEQLKLSLMQAQNAALGYHPTLYQQSLKQAIAVINTHFDLDQPQTQQVISALENLATTNVERVLPVSLNSQVLLQDALTRSSAPPVVPTETPEPAAENTI